MGSFLRWRALEQPLKACPLPTNFCNFLAFTIPLVIAFMCLDILAVLCPGRKKALCIPPPTPVEPYWGFPPGELWSKRQGAWLWTAPSASSVRFWAKLQAQAGFGQTGQVNWLHAAQADLSCTGKPTRLGTQMQPGAELRPRGAYHSLQKWWEDGELKGFACIGITTEILIPK